MPRRRHRGTGSLKLRGRIWWIIYTADGGPVYESSHSSDRSVADKLLKQRIGEIAAGRDLSPEKATIDDLCALVIADAKLRRLRDAKHQEWRYEANIKPAIGSLLASRFGTSQIRVYVEFRRKAGAKDSTINRELALVRRGFALGYREDPPLVRRVPHIPLLEENNARQGFIEQARYERILGELPVRLKALFVVGYHVGCRLGELRKLKWEQVDLDTREIRLRASDTKTKESRTVPIYGDMSTWLSMQRASSPDGCSWVFYGRLNRPVGAHLTGWRNACEAAGAPGLFFHDLRRSAVRNMTRAGIPRPIAMAITGHKTESMYKRYDIVSGEDLAGVGEQMERFLKTQRAAKLQRVK